ncbi:MAG: NAD-dependent epimerase/dehydratase family protein [Acidobacteriota bacterium]
MPLKLLFIGGTGNLSMPCVQLAAAEGHAVTVLTRGTRDADLPESVIRVTGDGADRSTLAGVAAQHFDAIVNFVAFDAADVRRDIEVFGGRTGQYVFVSSAAVYRRPPPSYVVTEDSPLGNPHWEYARKKIDAEDRLRVAHRDTAFPMTIVRPSYTYGRSWVPTTSGSDYTVVYRLRRSLELVVPGDGSSLVVLTHATDFARGLVGLLGERSAIGEAFHITSDEVQCWDQVHEAIARIVDAVPRLVHIPSDFIARIDARRGASLLGDKAWSVVFDNSKLRSVVPGFRARVRFEDGVRASIAWLDADSARQHIDANESVERILAAYQSLITHHSS